MSHIKSMTADRYTVLNKKPHSGNVLYLAHRDQRVFENYSVLLGYDLSYNSKTKFYIGCLFPSLKINCIQQKFIVEGFEELQKDCKKLNIPFMLFDDVNEFIKEHEIDCVITDFNPMRNTKLEFDDVAHYECDSHNLVPARVLSKYKRTSKSVKDDLFKVWTTYLKEFDDVEPHKYNKKEEVESVKNDFEYYRTYKFNTDEPSQKKKKGNALLSKDFFNLVAEPKYSTVKGGYEEGMNQVEIFFTKKFPFYSEQRNKPDFDALSNLSPWIHSGQISSQKVIMMARKRFSNSNENLDTFIKEIFPCKETADHFCMHEENYDNIKGALDWARKSLNLHKEDERETTYTLDQLERGKTHDTLWNCAQKEMVLSGKMHGYVRMFWAKKFLHWTETPEQAIEYGIYLNDKYSIDGNDPNGYLGVMWSICGSMDQGFAERPVSGKIRPMNAFKSEKYIEKWSREKI